MLEKRSFVLDIKALTEKANQRNSAIMELNKLQEMRNAKSKSIGELRAKKNQDTAMLESEMALVRSYGEQIDAIKEELAKIEADIETVLLFVPNCPSEKVPIGKSDADNPVERVFGQKPLFTFAPKDHYDIGLKMGIFDFEAGSKMSGPRFSVIKGAGVRLEMAIKNFLFDFAVNTNGYTPVSVPFVVQRTAITVTGQLPKFEFDMFKTKNGDREMFLIPTAEVPVTNIHFDEILAETTMPKYYCALTPCFRAEAGSAGKDVKGLIRQHQFEKLEMVKFVLQEESEQELEKLTANAEAILQKLNLHYRVVSLCTGDLPFASTYTYDLEVWMPGQNRYLEVSSCSNMGDYQARRGKIRVRRKNSSVELVHTLNGSGLPVGRLLISIIEQNQQEDGSVVIPDALQRYTGFSRIRNDGTIE